MKRLAAHLAVAVLLISMISCVSTKTITFSVDRVPEKKARTDLIAPLLGTLRDFGNNMAVLMLKDYRFQDIQETGGGAYLYRFDATSEKLPKYAYIVFRLEGRPSISTNVGSKNYIMLDGASLGLVPADEPAVLKDGGFRLQFTKTKFVEAFNPFVIGDRGTYPEQLLLWFKNPSTKDADMKTMATLLLSAFPRLSYK